LSFVTPRLFRDRIYDELIAQKKPAGRRTLSQRPCIISRHPAANRGSRKDPRSPGRSSNSAIARQVLHGALPAPVQAVLRNLSADSEIADFQIRPGDEREIADFRIAGPPRRGRCARHSGGSPRNGSPRDDRAGRQRAHRHPPAENQARCLISLQPTAAVPLQLPEIPWTMSQACFLLSLLRDEGPKGPAGPGHCAAACSL
jgi:hypothetical protein